jgi:hypothetical protein
VEGLLLGRVGDEAGDEAVGELLESLVNLGLELGQGGGIVGELLGPEALPGDELLADLLDGLVGGADIGPLVGVEADAHGKSFLLTSLFRS